MYRLEDGRKHLAVYQRESNNHIMISLDMRSPNQMLDRYLGVMVRPRLSNTLRRTARRNDATVLPQSRSGRICFANLLSFLGCSLLAFVKPMLDTPALMRENTVCDILRSLPGCVTIEVGSRPYRHGLSQAVTCRMPKEYLWNNHNIASAASR